MPLCGRDNSWFENVLKNDIVFISQNQDKYARQYDSRTTTDVIHKGWAAIHYASALGQAEIFKVLFNAEYDLLTDKDADVNCPSLGHKVTIYGGSSIVHILIATNQVALMNIVFQKWQENQEFIDLAGAKNDMGETGLLCSAHYNTDAGYMWACNEKTIRNEIRIVSEQNQNFVMVVAYYGRENLANLIQDLVDQQKLLKIEGQIDRLKEVIKEQLSSMDSNGEDWKILADKDIDYTKFVSSKEAKIKVKSILDEVVKFLALQ